MSDQALCIFGCGRPAFKRIYEKTTEDGTLVYSLACDICYQKFQTEAIPA